MKKAKRVITTAQLPSGFWAVWIDGVLWYAAGCTQMDALAKVPLSCK